MDDEEKDLNDGAFWILFKDFFQFFYSVTINYTSDEWNLVRISDQVPDESWGVAHLHLDKPTELAFLSLIQMNQKFFDPEEDGKDENQFKEQGDTLAATLVNEMFNSECYKDKG